MKGAEAAPRQRCQRASPQGACSTHPPLSHKWGVGGVSGCLHRLLTHSLSYCSFHSCLQHGLLHLILSWLRRGRKEGEGGGRGEGERRGEGKGREEQEVGEKQKGSFKTAETSSFHSPPPLQKNSYDRLIGKQ